MQAAALVEDVVYIDRTNRTESRTAWSGLPHGWVLTRVIWVLAMMLLIALATVASGCAPKDDGMSGGSSSTLSPAQQRRQQLLGPLGKRIPADRHLWAIRKMADQALRGLSPLFEDIYADRGHLSTLPEYLLRALLVQVLYAIPSKREL